jgi:uncharacterized protein (TIGR00730 family)
MSQTRDVKRVCVYCASSQKSDPRYLEAARRLGRTLAENGISIVYGGGAVGSMGCLADGALEASGQVIGVLPSFMNDLEWGHPRLSELKVVDDLHTRKRVMLEGTDAAIALPGGSGTFEELLEAITWKRLGLYLQPIVLVNIRSYYDPLLEMLRRAIDERFMDPRHDQMWRVAQSVEEVLPAIQASPAWSPDARRFAALA